MSVTILIILLSSVGLGVAHAQLRAGRHNFCIDYILYATIKVNKSIKSYSSVVAHSVPTSGPQPGAAMLDRYFTNSLTLGA